MRNSCPSIDEEKGIYHPLIFLTLQEWATPQVLILPEGCFKGWDWENELNQGGWVFRWKQKEGPKEPVQGLEYGVRTLWVLSLLTGHSLLTCLPLKFWAMFSCRNLTSLIILLSLSIFVCFFVCFHFYDVNQHYGLHYLYYCLGPFGLL